MKRIILVKMLALIIVLIIGSLGFLFTSKSQTQTIKTSETPEAVADAVGEISGYKNWTQVNKKPELVFSRIAAMCAMPSQAQIDEEEKNPHNNKFINVFVNDIGKDEMMTKKSPKFPVGTVIVKEKLPTADSKQPELLTVMIKRAKGFNPEVGDWEFLTFTGDAAKMTARGKLESCQACHVAEEPTDYVSRKYLPFELRKKLK